MNKTLYYNNSSISFLDSPAQVSENETINFYEAGLKKGRSLRAMLNNFSEKPHQVQIMLRELSFEDVLKELKKDFHYIEAAGGYIQKGDEYLFIHRHGRWDLPKGKLEKGEALQDAAIRECEEECGV